MTPTDARSLSRADYSKLKSDALRDLRLASHGDREFLHPAPTEARPDAKAMDRETYQQFRSDARRWRTRKDNQ